MNIKMYINMNLLLVCVIGPLCCLVLFDQVLLVKVRFLSSQIVSIIRS
jgi:hypothetical protein